MATTLETAKSLLSPPGDTIQEHIDFIGMSQAELARVTGKSDAQINRWVKKGVIPSLDNRNLLLRALNAPVERGEVEGEFFTHDDIWKEANV